MIHLAAPAAGGGGQVNQEIIPDSHWLTLCVRIILVAAKEFRSRLPQILLSRY